MANKILVQTDTPIVFADTDDYSSSVTGLARTHQLDLTGISSGAARQSEKADLGANRAKQYRVFVGVEFATDPADNNRIEIWWAGSPSSTAGNANPGGVTGSDADYTGTAGSSLAESLQQLEYLGSLVLTNDNTTVVQYGYVGVLQNPDRYGSVVLFNNSDDALHSDAVEMLVALIPIADEIQ